MAKVYLKGSDVENDSDRRKARLLSINHEAYVYYCNEHGNDYYPSCSTKYCFPLKEKMEAVLDGNNDPVLDGFGNPTYQGTGEYCIELDNDDQTELGAYYSSLYSGHASKLVSRATMEDAGWFIDE